MSCPACLGGEGNLCWACEKAGLAKCPCCDKYRVLSVRRYACGCVDDEALCATCGAGVEQDVCNACLWPDTVGRKRKQQAEVRP